MTKEQVDTLLSQINALVDNAGSMTEQGIYASASEIQRLAANVPSLHTLAANGWTAVHAVAKEHGALMAEDTALSALERLGVKS